MQDIISNLVQSLGYAGVLVLMCFFAAELIMPFAGYIAWTGNLTLWGVVIAGTLGSSLGSVVLYYVARFLEQSAVHSFVRRYGKWVGVSLHNLERSEKWFDKHAKTTVFLGKLLPAVRTATSVSAGYRHMSFLPYLACTLTATTLWSSLLAGAGFMVTDKYETVQNAGSYLSFAIVAAAIAYLVARIIIRRKTA